jgi:hypothetical protein
MERASQIKGMQHPKWAIHDPRRRSQKVRESWEKRIPGRENEPQPKKVSSLVNESKYQRMPRLQNELMK